MVHRIQYSPEALKHLGGLTAAEQRRVTNSIDVQLTHEPDRPTRNRKPMRPNPLAEWELRTGDLRVYYNVRREPEPLVSIGAVGRKVGNKVIVGGEELEL